VIGTSGTTYDPNGNVTGQLNPLPTYSWTGTSYKLGSVESFQALLLQLENSYSGFAGANASGNNTAVKFFPPLANCSTTPSTCPLGPGDAIWNAYQDLVYQLTNSDACSGAAQLWVFNKINKYWGGDTNGVPIDTKSFLRYLSNTPHFVDGTQSTWEFKNAFCGSGRPWWRFQSLNCQPPAGSTTIEASFLDEPTTSAETETPSYPLTIFFRPSGTYGIQLATNGKNLFNESVFFHEALHGATGEGDASLQMNLGYNGSQPSSVISGYIQTHVLSACPVGVQ
jgi:hypothetical protein